MLLGLENIKDGKDFSTVIRGRPGDRAGAKREGAGRPPGRQFFQDFTAKARRETTLGHRRVSKNTSLTPRFVSETSPSPSRSFADSGKEEEGKERKVPDGENK